MMMGEVSLNLAPFRAMFMDESGGASSVLPARGTIMIWTGRVPLLPRGIRNV